MSVGESEGGMVPEEELSPGEGVRTPEPPFAESPDLFGGRPRLDSSIGYLGPCRASRRNLLVILGLWHEPNARTRGTCKLTKYITSDAACQRRIGIKRLFQA